MNQSTRVPKRDGKLEFLVLMLVTCYLQYEFHDPKLKRLKEYCYCLQNCHHQLIIQNKSSAMSPWASAEDWTHMTSASTHGSMFRRWQRRRRVSRTDPSKEWKEVANNPNKPSTLPNPIASHRPRNPPRSSVRVQSTVHLRINHREMILSGSASAGKSPHGESPSWKPPDSQPYRLLVDLTRSPSFQIGRKLVAAHRARVPHGEPREDAVGVVNMFAG